MEDQCDVQCAFHIVKNLLCYFLVLVCKPSSRHGRYSDTSWSDTGMLQPNFDTWVHCQVVPCTTWIGGYQVSLVARCPTIQNVSEAQVKIYTVRCVILPHLCVLQAP